MKENNSVLKNSRTMKALTLSLLVLCISVISVSAQVNMVRGVVRTPDGDPLLGTTVVVDGTNRGTSTDDKGNYQIAVKNGDILVFHYIGMRTERMPYQSQAAIDVTMSNDFAAVDEIIVIGYGQAKKGSLTGAISQINSDKLLTTPSTNIAASLAGHIPGMASVQSSGEPGNDRASLKIRGAAADALLIVDGIKRNIDLLDPMEVETISVLKDAAAAAVYGLEAQGGVIIVTTKKGTRGKNEITYRGKGGVSMNTSYPEFLDGPGYAYWYNKALELDGKSPLFTQGQVDKMMNGDDSDGWGNTNWFDELFGTGTHHEHSLSMSGGGDKATYFASLGYMNQVGNIKNFKFNRYNARLNLDAKIAKNLNFSMGLAGQIGEKTSAGFSAGGTYGSDISESAMPWLSIAEQAAFSHPYLPRYYVAPPNATQEQLDNQGLPIATQNAYGNPVNPIAATQLSGINKSINTNIQSNVSLEWTAPWVKGLSAKFTGSYDTYFNNARSHRTPFRVMSMTGRDGTNELDYRRQWDARDESDISMTESYGQVQKATTQSAIAYKNTFGKHRVDGLFLIETRDDWSKNMYASAKGMLFPDISQLDQADGTANKVSGNYGPRQKKAGFIGRAVYEYDNRYIAEVSGRYDGSYKFIGNINGRRWGFFPSASVAWRISNEEFFKSARHVVNNLKLKFSYGELGNDGVSEFAYLSRFSGRDKGLPQVVIGGNPSGTYYSSVVANPHLTWDRERQYNAGIEATLWNGLLGVELDVFYKHRFDILGEQPESKFPPSMGGYYKSFINHNATDTKGFDFTLIHNNKVGEFEYGVKFIASYAKTRWTKHIGDTPNTAEYARMGGKQTYMYMGLKADGLFRSEEEIDNSPYVMGRRPRVGDIKYIDLDGDGVVDAEKDRGFFGRSVFPTWTGSLNLYASWKGIDINLMFTGGAGNDVRLAGTYANTHDDTTIFTRPFKANANSPRYLVEDSWTPDNPNGKYPRLSIEGGPSNLNGFSSTFWFEDGKYLRLKNFQIGYTLPQSVVKHIGASNIRIFIEGTNVFTWSGLPDGFDPELPSVTMGYYPQQRIFMGGLTVTF